MSDNHGMRGDAGLFGPDTVTWHLHADSAMWIAGICSLYLQALHPRAVAAIVQNSRFEQDPVGRLMRTGNFVATTTYGTHEEVDKAARRVRRVHRELSATDPRTGAAIQLDDPHLLTWVHCAEVTCFAVVVAKAGFPLTGTLVDRYFDEQRRSAELVGLDPESVPGSRREMAAYFTGIRPELEWTPDAETVYQFLHKPITAWWSLPVNLSYLPVGHLAFSLLPAWALETYGHPALPEPAVTVALRCFRAVGTSLPRAVRWRYPADHIERAIKRLGAHATPSPAAPSGLSKPQG